MRLVHLIALAFVSALFASLPPASAATVSCSGSGSGQSTASFTIEITTALGSSCLLTGNGESLNGNNDHVMVLGYELLDTTLIAGLVPLTFTDIGGTSGSFSFVANAQYDSYVLGVYAAVNPPHPDWFAFALAEGITSGTWTLSSGAQTVGRALLYGKLAEDVTPVPVPAALVLFGSALAGFFGFSKLRRRFQTPVPA